MQVMIQYQDQFGSWHNYQRVSDNPYSIKQTMLMALNNQLTQKSRKVRAVDDNQRLLDMMQG
jgi:hypothetical protein